MTPEQKRVHLALSSTLPSRFHYKPGPEQDAVRLGGRERQPVELNGKTYASMTAAAKDIGRSRQHIYHLLKRGKAT